MNTHAIAIFKGELPSGIFVDAYSIFTIDEWNAMKNAIEKYEKDFHIFVGKHKNLKNMCNDFMSFIDGHDFLSNVAVNEITQNEYNSFTNIMPTYFGEEEIFQDVMEIVES